MSNGCKETAEPKTLADLWLMKKTSSGWFDGQIKYDNSMREEVVGGVYSIAWLVRVSPGGVNVIKRIDRYDEINGNKASISGTEDGYIHYRTLEEFRASEWWEPTMEAWEGGYTDASWLRDFEVDGEKIEDDVWPEFADHCIELSVGRQFKDWLGNARQKEGYDRLSIDVDQLSGYLELRCGDYEVFGTVKEISHAMLLLTLMEQEGIEVTDRGLAVKFHGGDDDAD